MKYAKIVLTRWHTTYRYLSFKYTMDKIVEKVLEIINKLTDEQKAEILKQLSPAPKAEWAEGEATQPEWGKWDLDQNGNPKVQDQQNLMEKFLQHGSTR